MALFHNVLLKDKCIKTFKIQGSYRCKICFFFFCLSTKNFLISYVWSFQPAVFSWKLVSLSAAEPFTEVESFLTTPVPATSDHLLGDTLAVWRAKRRPDCLSEALRCCGALHAAVWLQTDYRLHIALLLFVSVLEIRRLRRVHPLLSFQFRSREIKRIKSHLAAHRLWLFDEVSLEKFHSY